MDVIFELLRGAQRPRYSRGKSRRLRVLRLHPLQTQFHLANGIEILVHSAPVGGAKRTLQLLHRAGYGCQNASIFVQPEASLFGVATLAKKALKYEPGIVLHRQRRGGGSPRERVA